MLATFASSMRQLDEGLSAIIRGDQRHHAVQLLQGASKESLMAELTRLEHQNSALEQQLQAVLSENCDMRSSLTRQWANLKKMSDFRRKLLLLLKSITRSESLQGLQASRIESLTYDVDSVLENLFSDQVLRRVVPKSRMSSPLQERPHPPPQLGSRR